MAADAVIYVGVSAFQCVADSPVSKDRAGFSTAPILVVCGNPSDLCQYEPQRVITARTKAERRYEMGTNTFIHY